MLTEDQLLRRRLKTQPRAVDPSSNLFDSAFVFGAPRNEKPSHLNNFQVGFGRKNPNVGRKRLGKGRHNRLIPES